MRSEPPPTFLRSSLRVFSTHANICGLRFKDTQSAAARKSGSPTFALPTRGPVTETNAPSLPVALSALTSTAVAPTWLQFVRPSVFQKTKNDRKNRSRPMGTAMIDLPMLPRNPVLSRSVK